MTQEYTINFVSRLIYYLRGFLSIAIGLCVTLVITTSLIKQLPILVFVILDALITLSLFYLSRNWHNGQLLIHVNEKELSIESHLTFLRHSRKFVFYWSEISRLSFSDTQYFKILVIRDTKKKVSFAMNHGDDVTQFEQKLNNQMNKLETEGVITSQKPSIYATNLGIAIAMLLGLIMISWPLVAWVNQREFQIGFALIFYSSAGFFIYMVYRMHKKKPSE